ncbi:unnamed protein product [Effrenium voratum]|nr:unnamed protein product [Effrenium voratum]
MEGPTAPSICGIRGCTERCEGIRWDDAMKAWRVRCCLETVTMSGATRKSWHEAYAFGTGSPWVWATRPPKQSRVLEEKKVWEATQAKQTKQASDLVAVAEESLRRQGGQAGTRHRALSRDWRCLETRCSSLGPGKTQRHLVALPKWARTTSAAHRRSKNTLQVAPWQRMARSPLGKNNQVAPWQRMARSPLGKNNQAAAPESLDLEGRVLAAERRLRALEKHLRIDFQAQAGPSATSLEDRLCEVERRLAKLEDKLGKSKEAKAKKRLRHLQNPEGRQTGSDCSCGALRKSTDLWYLSKSGRPKGSLCKACASAKQKLRRAGHPQ